MFEEWDRVCGNKLYPRETLRNLQGLSSWWSSSSLWLLWWCLPYILSCKRRFSSIFWSISLPKVLKERKEKTLIYYLLIIQKQKWLHYSLNLLQNIKNIDEKYKYFVIRIHLSKKYLTKTMIGYAQFV